MTYKSKKTFKRFTVCSDWKAATCKTEKSAKTFTLCLRRICNTVTLSTVMHLELYWIRKWRLVESAMRYVLLNTDSVLNEDELLSPHYTTKLHQVSNWSNFSPHWLPKTIMDTGISDMQGSLAYGYKLFAPSLPHLAIASPYCTFQMH